MVPPLFVLARNSADAGWAVVAGPTDSAGAVQAIDDALTTRPGARALVCGLLRSFTAAATVSEDATPTTG